MYGSPRICISSYPRMLLVRARRLFEGAGGDREPARYAAAELLRLGYQVGSGALVPVWSDHVLPLLVTRTSRPFYPWSVVGYARELGTHFGSYEHIGAGVWRDGSSGALIRGER